MAELSSTPPAATRYEVTLVDAADVYEVVLPLWNSGMSDSEIPHRVQQRFAWLYSDNPSGRPLTWIVRDAGSRRVLGACTVVPHMLEVAGRSYRAGMLVDFIVDPAARVAGPAIALQRGVASQALEQGFELLFGYPNAKAWPIFSRLGYKVLGTTRYWAKPLQSGGAWIKRYVQPRAQRLMPGRMGMRISDAVLSATAAAVQWSLVAIEKVVVAKSRLHGYSATLQPLTREPATLGSQRQSTLRTASVASFRGWRFVRHPTHKLWLFEILRHGKPAAWTVLRIHDGTCEVQDAAWIDGDKRLPSLLWWLLPGELRNHQLRSVTVGLAGARSIDSTLARALFVERDLGRRVIYRLPPGADPHLEKNVNAQENWYMFGGELDI